MLDDEILHSEVLLLDDDVDEIVVILADEILEIEMLEVLIAE